MRLGQRRGVCCASEYMDTYCTLQNEKNRSVFSFNCVCLREELISGQVGGGDRPTEPLFAYYYYCCAICGHSRAFCPTEFATLPVVWGWLSDHIREQPQGAVQIQYGSRHQLG